MTNKYSQPLIKNQRREGNEHPRGINKQIYIYVHTYIYHIYIEPSIKKQRRGP
jgi:hypothetical protein